MQFIGWNVMTMQVVSAAAEPCQRTPVVVEVVSVTADVSFTEGIADSQKGTVTVGVSRLKTLANGLSGAGLTAVGRLR